MITGVLPLSTPLVWLVIERTPRHLTIDATEEGTGRHVRLVLSLAAVRTMATALHVLAKTDPSSEPSVLDFATKARIETA